MSVHDSFLGMRADLVQRGLLTADFELTEAGHAYVDELIERLPEQEAPQEPWKQRVYWRFNRAPSRRSAEGLAPQDERESAA